MQTATQANELNNNIGHDFTMMDAEDVEYLETEEDVEAERLRVNLEMARWFGM